MIRTIFVALICLAALAGTARADGPSCTATAATKKLAGAAQTSFMKKCTTDAAATCESTAKTKKLFGAAHDSFVKKCVADATG
jgi:hypothetical protein